MDGQDPVGGPDPSTDEAAAARARLRRVGRSRRAALPLPVRAAAARTVVARLAADPRVAVADGVLLTAAVGEELDLASLWPVLWQRGTELALPRVDGPDLVPVAVTPSTPLAPGWRGVPEPAGAPVDLAEGSWVVLAPGLAFDARGNRLGYGGGHFDRLLAAHPTVTPLGACFACQLVARVPAQPHDVRMADVVTEGT